jgi:hypothetical protein
MKQIVRNVRDIDAEHRSAIEDVVGQSLRDSQQIIIQIADVDGGSNSHETDVRRTQSVAEWLQVYEGLSEQQIGDIDAIIKSRANLTRSLQ